MEASLYPTTILEREPGDHIHGSGLTLPRPVPSCDPSRGRAEACSMVEWAVRVRNLGKKYELYDRPSDRLRELLSPTRHRYSREVWALRDVDLDIERGKVVGVVGVNGAGKSTLLKLISGSVSPSSGTI